LAQVSKNGPVVTDGIAVFETGLIVNMICSPEDMVWWTPDCAAHHRVYASVPQAAIRARNNSHQAWYGVSPTQFPITPINANSFSALSLVAAGMPAALERLGPECQAVRFRDLDPGYQRGAMRAKAEIPARVKPIALGGGTPALQSAVRRPGPGA
jgi:hypothetical protein